MATAFELSSVAQVNADMIDKSGMAEWEICALCHSADGVSVMAKFPKLAGQKVDYIERQFKQFLAGQRDNDGGQMQSITTEVELQDLPKIAAYFAELPPPPVAELTAADIAGSSELARRVKRGKILFEKGKGELPSCASCHAELNSPAPWIDGQHQAYLEKQLLDFREGRRKDAALGQMPTIAKGLSEEDIAAVATFLANLKLPRK